ncbi:hypothetical protein [Sulfitobacter sp. SK011]|uniref:hypothetical protein n=1 Tax=Sulfitobacter sp. SK011 TaxID=1389004 RepID=UPI000E0C0DA5|nr:hypothetical protein [Sulfitobacter sp. SK011]AXI42817.1 hypothetical protein C1J02_13360 [Sulfitobacter sp. SK011]
MPTEFYLIIGGCVAVMGLSAFYLGDENKSTRALARVGIVMGGSGLFVATLFYAAIFAAVLIVMLPILLIAAWWNGAF